jgi:DNA polymerase-1
MRDVSIDKQTQYAVEDADIALQLKEHFQNELGEASTQKLFDEIEVPLLRVLADMELEGINLDVSFLQHLSTDLDKDILRLKKDIYESAGIEFNIASPKQLGEVFIRYDETCCQTKEDKNRTILYSRRCIVCLGERT